jgi:hypothetical protein
MDMDSSERIAAASSQLDRVLGFFPRVDNKISALFAVNVGMLTVLVLNFSAKDVYVWYLVLLGVLVVLGLGASLVLLYTASFPQLAGGEQSLVYFREIAKRTESNFIQEARECDPNKQLTDLLGQVWRNSQILRIKYDRTKWAFIATAITLPIWLAQLLLAGIDHANFIVR